MARKSRSRNRTIKNKIWKQVGCSSAGLGQKAGQYGGFKLPSLPDALIGKPWTVNHEGNYYKLNNYKHDFVNRPILEGSQIRVGGLKGGSKIRKRNSRVRKSKKNRSRINRSRINRSRLKIKQTGGNSFYKLMPSDLLNVGRYATNNVGNFYNGTAGYSQAVSEMPWDQPFLKSSLSNFKI
jgi:hypothetical protein